jgi:hypothetical protein
MGTLLLTDFQSMLIGIGAVAFIIVAALVFSIWEGKKATTAYQKRLKKNGKTL